MTQSSTKSKYTKKIKIYLVTALADKKANRDFLYVNNFLATIFILNMAHDRNNLAFTQSI